MSTSAIIDEQADLRDELRRVAQDLLASTGTDGDADWAALAAAGWSGLEIPEHLDGAGVTFSEVAVICEELGRAAVNSAYLGSVVLGVGALVQVEATPRRDRLLRDLASGEALATVAIPGHATGGAFAPSFSLEHARDGLRLHGRADFVPDAPGARTLLVPASQPDGAVVLVAIGAGELAVADQPVLDASRRLGVVVADGVAVDEAQLWRFVGDGRTAVRTLLNRAALAVACDSLGVAEAMLARTVAYVQVRRQFGRAVGSFQAVKHACADMHVGTAVARQLIKQAVEQLAGGDADAGTAVAMAKAYAGEAAVEVAGTAMQLHGGIGYTWESGIHRYLKRAALARTLFGSPSVHRAQLAARFR